MKSGIKKTDCIVLIFCIIFLLAVMGSVGKRGRELGKRMICASNIRQLAAGCINYANENGGKIPTSSSYWPWDISRSAVNALLDSMGVEIEQPTPVQDVFYCPANIPQRRFRDVNWNFGGNAGGIRICSYAFVWKASWNTVSGVPGTIPILGWNGIGSPIMTPDPAKNNCTGTTCTGKWVDRTDMPQASEAELIVEATLSQRTGSPASSYDPVKYPYGNFATIACGGNPGQGASDSSSHLVNDAKPAGGNIGFADGHVEWRPFSEMKVRYITYGNNPGGCPRWWW